MNRRSLGFLLSQGNTGFLHHGEVLVNFSPSDLRLPLIYFALAHADVSWSPPSLGAKCAPG